MLGDSHEWQWIPRYEVREVGMKGGEPAKLLRLVLKCMNDSSHQEKTAVELAAVREAAWSRMHKDIEEWLHSETQTVLEDPRITRPIFECEECFAAWYDGGDYKTQEPGKLRETAKPSASAMDTN
jgi:hypothetical protein